MTVVAGSARIADTLHHAASELAAASIDDARLEADVLFAHVLGIDRARLLASLGDAMPAESFSRFLSLLARRLTHEPLAYIVGRREFYGIDIASMTGALIPRPETEMLVDLALREVRRRGPCLHIVDVGTGSGAVAIAIAANAPGVSVTAIDASEAALAVARRNAVNAGVVDRVRVRCGDLLDRQGPFDVIVANLPYVSEAEWCGLAPEIREHEPREALVGGQTGVEVIGRLLQSAQHSIAPGGVIGAEIGATQAVAVLGMARENFPGAESRVMKDLAGCDRMLVVRTRGG
jgi:release factor glutamine methyltransferase